MDGWFFFDVGNWVEPDQWRKGQAPGIKCYAKVPTGMCPNMRKLEKVPSFFFELETF